MNEFDMELDQRLTGLRDQGLRRELSRIDSPQGAWIEISGRRLLNFSSNDYLGLANEPRLKEAAMRAVERFGAGCGASRLISGSSAAHHELEAILANFKRTEAALSFSSGYAAAMGAICALMDKDDVVVLDRLCHASIIDGARLSGAKLRIFPHNDLNGLEKVLKWINERPRPAESRVGTIEANRRVRRRRTLIVTESVFSMDGDHAPLRELVNLKERYGAWLMVDEAHATGLYGSRRRGLAEANGVSDQIEIQMGTLGKALGASGGFICGSRQLIDYLIHRARSFIFSTAPIPSAAGAAAAGVRFAQSEEGRERCARLRQRAREFGEATSDPRLRDLAASAAASARMGQSTDSDWTAIIPLMIGEEFAATQIASQLRDEGIFVPAIRFPTVPRGTARLRVTLTAAHTGEDIARLADALNRLGLTRPGVWGHSALGTRASESNHEPIR